MTLITLSMGSLWEVHFFRSACRHPRRGVGFQPPVCLAAPKKDQSGPNGPQEKGQVATAPCKNVFARNGRTFS